MPCVLLLQWEHRVEKSQEEFEAISKSIVKEMKRFERQRLRDFKRAVVVYLESLMANQQQVATLYIALYKYILMAPSSLSSSLSFCLSLCAFLYISLLYLPLSLPLTFRLCLFVSVCLSFLSPSFLVSHSPSLYLSICIWLASFLCPSVSLSLYLFLLLSPSLCPSVSYSVTVSVFEALEALCPIWPSWSHMFYNNKCILIKIIKSLFISSWSNTGNHFCRRRKRSLDRALSQGQCCRCCLCCFVVSCQTETVVTSLVFCVDRSFCCGWFTHVNTDIYN